MFWRKQYETKTHSKSRPSLLYIEKIIQSELYDMNLAIRYNLPFELSAKQYSIYAD